MITFKKVLIAQGGHYTTVCLLDYNYFNSFYKMIATDWRKQQALESDTKAIQEIHLTGNLNWSRNAGCEMINANTTISFTIEEAKETMVDFSEGTVKVLQFYL